MPQSETRTIKFVNVVVVWNKMYSCVLCQWQINGEIMCREREQPLRTLGVY